MYRIFYSRFWPIFSGATVITIFGVFISTVVAAGELFVGVFDPFVRYMLAFIVVQAAILFLLILCLILWKIRRIRGEKAYHSCIYTFRDRIARFTAGQIGREGILELAQKFPVEFLDAAGEALHVLKGSAQRQVESLVLHSRPYEDLLRPVSNRSPRHMLQALSLLPLLSDSRSRRAIESGLSHPSPVVRLAAQITSLRCGSEHTQLDVLQRIPQLRFFEKMLVYLQFPKDSPLVTEFLKKTLHSENDCEVLCALEFILNHEKLVPVTVPDSLSESSTPEIRIKYFKAFHLMPSPHCSLSLLRKGLFDEDWRVRAMAARACGLMGIDGLEPELLKMVAQARTSTEARHAAKALVSFGGETIQKLEELRLSGTETVHRIISEAIEKEILLGVEAAR